MAEKLDKDTFGENLRREREMRGVTLLEISTATRIAVRFLEAIENEQWDQLPGGVFNRGFVRAVARYLGLDEESVVGEYALAIGDRPSVPVWTGSPPAVTPQMPWFPLGLIAAGMILLLVGGWFGTRRVILWRAARRSARTAAAVTPPAPLASGAAAPVVLANPSQDDLQPQPAAADSSATSPRLELKLEAHQTTTVTVAADTLPVFNGTMRAGETQSFMAQDRFQITAADAGAIAVQFDGQAEAPLGLPGQAGSMTLTRDDLKAAPGGVH